MEYSINIPYEQLARECGIVNPVNSRDAISSVLALSSRFNNDQLILIYNYFFEHSNSYEILIFLLEKIDKYRDISSRDLLIDSLLMKENLTERLQDNDKLTRLRIKITKVLAHTKDSKAVYPLLYCLNNPEENYKIKLSCAEALGKIGDRYAVIPLINIIENEKESSIYVKESAISALGMLGDYKALDPIASILESKNEFVNKFTFLKERALEALNKFEFKNDKVMRAVEKSLSDDSPQIRINAIEVLMNSSDRKAVELIKNMLYDTNSEVVNNAVIALYNILGDYILEEIINNENMQDSAKTSAIQLKETLQQEGDESDE